LWLIEPSRIDVFGCVSVLRPLWGMLLSCRTGCRAAQSPGNLVRNAALASAEGACRCHPVTSEPVRIGWLGWPGWPAAARAAGCVAAVLIAVVGCTTVTDGSPGADEAIAPAYRTSVSVSVSESSVTSSIKESKHQQSLTTQAIFQVCKAFADSSKEAVDRVNDYVAATNQGRDTSGTEQPAIDALNHSAEAVAGDNNGPVSQQLREALTAYNDAAHEVAGAIRAHAGIDQFNQRVNQLNDTKTTAVKLCRASL
jgi:hypothetical protein